MNFKMQNMSNGNLKFRPSERILNSAKNFTTREVEKLPSLYSRKF